MRVVHCKLDPYDEYVGRPSFCGNPFTVAQYGRSVAVKQFEEKAKNDPAFRRRVKAFLCDKQTLGCWCAPKGGVGLDDPLICHGQILGRIVRGDYDE